MSKGLLNTCEELYGTKDLYELFSIDKKASEQEIKKAYYRLSLKTHPDRVPEDDKQTATERFKVLSKLYSVLADKDKRALYDERGIVDDEGENEADTWKLRWQNLFKPLTDEDIDNFMKSYVGSELERTDIKKAYLNGRGCINYMNQTVPFMSCEDEPRVAKIVQELIDAGEVPAYDAFLKEPKAKRDRRHKKYAREAKLASEVKRQRDEESELSSLRKQLAVRNQERKGTFESMIASLEARYGSANGDDDEEEFVLASSKKSRSSSAKKAKTTTAKTATAAKGTRKSTRTAKS
ncbi:J domain-containing protein CG6693 [Anopheles aquasalis]|uniref:J domain-containing protein CG6693 n=1 Tax=Anopheles aquasalis TaxID=42839 RepID=UPI00215A8B96|nr:J domain-containing protein CG6693 [Anopheles aquasalis]